MMNTISDEAEEAELMDRYGIMRVPACEFLYKNYRYSNLHDAVAQARRDQAKPAK